MLARWLVREHAGARQGAIRPRRVDHGARLLFDDRFRFTLEPFGVAGPDDASDFETARIYKDGVAGGPILVEFAIRISLLGQRRVLPRRLLILSEVQHVVVMCVAAHPHRDSLDERRTLSGSRA